MIKLYMVPDIESPELRHFAALSPEHREEMLRVGSSYMSKIELIRCTVCASGEEYDGSKAECRACWFGVLDKLSRETSESEGWEEAMHDEGD